MVKIDDKLIARSKAERQYIHTTITALRLYALSRPIYPATKEPPMDKTLPKANTIETGVGVGQSLRIQQ
ncbi:hypothetical protein GI364_11730 [Alicyclobacillus sp. SO9]|nr:hypothetical protein GI364_11730 [Alicyclobacillus sp. SO9]